MEVSTRAKALLFRPVRDAKSSSSSIDSLCSLSTVRPLNDGGETYPHPMPYPEHPTSNHPPHLQLILRDSLDPHQLRLKHYPTLSAPCPL